MPNEKPQMRSSSPKEKLGDLIRSAYENISQQPIARIGDALGITNLRGMGQPDGSNQKLGMMPGGPGILRGMSRTPTARPMASAPPEFHAVEPNRFGPVDPNVMPSGQMKYMDPDMSPMMEMPGVVTEAGDKLRKLMGLR